MRDIDPETRDPSIAPEAQRFEEIGSDLGMIPVEIGLRWDKGVEVELTITDGFPYRSAEYGYPVGGGFTLLGAET